MHTFLYRFILLWFLYQFSVDLCDTYTHTLHGCFPTRGLIIPLTQCHWSIYKRYRPLEDLCTRNRYQGQGQVITSRGYLSLCLISASDTHPQFSLWQIRAKHNKVIKHAQMFRITCTVCWIDEAQYNHLNELYALNAYSVDRIHFVNGIW